MLAVKTGPKHIRKFPDTTVHMYTYSYWIKKFPLWRAFSKISGYGRKIRWIRVDASRMRKKKFAFSQISGYVWTMPQTRDICNSPRRASPMSPWCYSHPKRRWRQHFCKILGCKIISPQAPLPRLRTKYLFFLPLKIKLHSSLKTSIKHWFTPGEYGVYPWRIPWKLKLHSQRILYIFFLLYP